MNVYIYNIKELDYIKSFFSEVPKEMDLYDLFLEKLKNNYNIVDDITKCDVAFIPIDLVSLIFGRVSNWNGLYHYMLQTSNDNMVPKIQPPTFGVLDKNNYISFFWYNYVYHKLNLIVPHFILYPYVLFEISFDCIDKEIFILSYENEVSFFNDLNTKKIPNKMITIPYVLNENNLRQNIKEYNLGFIGTINSVDRPLLKISRNFLNILKNKIDLFIDEKIDLNNLSKIKYLFVLRGDTPTRKCFYQCFKYNIVPIIFESESKIYGSLILNGVNILDSCLIIPDIKENDDEYQYANNVYEIIKNELNNNNNYLDKIKNHNLIYEQLSYDTIKPIDNILNYLTKFNLTSLDSINI
jgi:hypothetical protein